MLQRPVPWENLISRLPCPHAGPTPAAHAEQATTPKVMVLPRKLRRVSTLGTSTVVRWSIDVTSCGRSFPSRSRNAHKLQRICHAVREGARHSSRWISGSEVGAGSTLLVETRRAGVVLAP